MSVDPFIQAPSNTQSINPYSYIMNNPLAGTDPTGYMTFYGMHRMAGGGFSTDKPPSGSSNPAEGMSSGGSGAVQTQKAGEKIVQPADIGTPEKTETVTGSSGGEIGASVGGTGDAEFDEAARNLNLSEYLTQGFSPKESDKGFFDGLSDFAGSLSLSDGASMVIPGWDLGACAIGSCSKSDWAWAAAGILPIGKAAKAFKMFKGDEAVEHFRRHSSEIMTATNRSSYNLKDYVNDANHLINNGTFVPEMNGYVRLIGGKGSAKYGFTGLDRNTGNITTFHVKSMKELMRKAPSLGLSK
jgi:hypothetical protein